MPDLRLVLMRLQLRGEGGNERNGGEAVTIPNGNQLTLGKLIEQLERRGQKQSVRYDFCGLSPFRIASYRGYYEDLAIGWREGEAPTVSGLLAELKIAIGCTFQGYKGGDFHMDAATNLWVSNWGECDGTAIVGVSGEDWETILETAKVD